MKKETFDFKQEYTITKNLEDHIGYKGQPVKLVKGYVENYFDVQDKDGNQWHCGEEELTETD